MNDETPRGKVERLKGALLDHLLRVMENGRLVTLESGEQAAEGPDEKFLAVVLNTVKAMKDEPGEAQNAVKAAKVSRFLQRYQTTPSEDVSGHA